MFGLCSLSSARSKSVLLVEENFVFYCGHSVLRYVPFAGPAGPTFSFLPFPSFSQRFLSEWKQCWFSPAWGSPLPLSLPTNGSHASNRADNLFRWCVPLPSSQNRTQALTVAYLFSPCSLLTFPLRGKAVLFSKLGCPGFLDSSTTASHGSNGAGLRPLWYRFPTRPSKPHTGPHRGKFVFTSVFPQPFPAGSNRQLLQHENVVGQKKIFSPMAFSLVSLSHIFSVGFPPRFSKYVLRILFFVLCGSIFAWRASPLLG